MQLRIHKELQPQIEELARKNLTTTTQIVNALLLKALQQQKEAE